MRRADLVADCARCAAVCCIATSFEASEDFARDKPAGVRCVHLSRGARCSIYAERVARGFGGCAQFDCYGAGVRATEAFALDSERNEAFGILRAVHELLFLLTEARRLSGPAHAALHAQLTRAIAALDALAPTSLADLRTFDLAAHEARAHALLRAVGEALGGSRARVHLQILR